MAGSRSRRRKKRAARVREGKPAAARPAEPRRQPAAMAAPTAVKDADPAALRAEVRALRKSLAAAEEKLNEAEARRTRAIARATAALRRENETLEAQLTLLVQEIGLVKHIIERVPRLEADLRAKDALLADRESAWQTERSLLQAEIARLAGPPVDVVKPKAARAAAGAPALEPAG